MHTTSQNESILTARALRKTWPGEVEAVRGIDLDVAAGEVFGLLGPNGAGKSTTIGMLTTAVAPTSGIARIAGFDVARDPIAARAVSGIVFQDAVVDRALTGRDNLLTHARLWGASSAVARRRVDEITAEFGLTDLVTRPVGTLSGGERRRLEIARALVTSPRLLFLDEPTVGLDPRIRYELLDLIAGLRLRDDLTVLLTTHYLDEAERLCDRIAIMYDGTIVAMGRPAQMLAEVGEVVVEFRAPSESDAAAVVRELHARSIARPEETIVVGRTVTVPLRDRNAHDVTTAVAALHLPAASITTRAPNLDDVYLRLTGDRIAA